MIPRPARLIRSMTRSGSLHSNLFLAVFSMLRHSKRCFTQVKPASCASLMSRSAASRWPQVKTWTADEAGAIRLPCTSCTDGAATLIGVGDATAGFGVAAVPAVGFTPGPVVAAGGGVLGVQPATATVVASSIDQS